MTENQHHGLAAHPTDRRFVSFGLCRTCEENELLYADGRCGGCHELRITDRSQVWKPDDDSDADCGVGV